MENEFPTSDEDSSTPDQRYCKCYSGPNRKFPTSDEDSSTPDVARRIHRRAIILFPTSDEDSSTPDHPQWILTAAHCLFPTSDEDSSTPDVLDTDINNGFNF